MYHRQLERILAVVERCLRKEFPEDFHKRCAYAAFGVRTLLRDAGASTELMGGDFLAFIVAQNNQHAGMSGFGFGEDQPAHFWVEGEDRIIDIGPHFLPREPKYPIVRMPAVVWPLTEPLPVYLRYRPQLRFPDAAGFSAEPAINERCDRFVAQCRERLASQRGHLEFPTWIVTGDASVRAAATRGDKWAAGALRFAQMTTEFELPF